MPCASDRTPRSITSPARAPDLAPQWQRPVLSCGYVLGGAVAAFALPGQQQAAAAAAAGGDGYDGGGADGGTQHALRNFQAGRLQLLVTTDACSEVITRCNAAPAAKLEAPLLAALPCCSRCDTARSARAIESRARCRHRPAKSCLQVAERCATASAPAADVTSSVHASAGRQPRTGGSAQAPDIAECPCHAHALQPLVPRQGIDVPECGLVVAMDPMKHVRHLMHTRGRTSARGGTFAALVGDRNCEYALKVGACETELTLLSRAKMHSMRAER
jgi:Helicase conserved C-terminal domain